MFNWAVIFLIIAIVAGVLGLSGIAGTEVVPLIRTTCLGVIFPVNHAAINGMMVS